MQVQFWGIGAVSSFELSRLCSLGQSSTSALPGVYAGVI